MTKFKIYKLRFTTPLHIGDERADYGTSLQTIHSDTLYAAITSVLAKISYPIPDDGDFGFSISSLFPYYEKDKKPVYFLPKLKSQTIPSKDLQTVAKKIKKIEWLDVGFFNKQINGEELFTDGFDTNLLENGKYLTKQPIDKEFISKEVNPRVQVSRDFSKDAEPFYMERLYFKHKSGMYFIAVGNDEKLKIIDTALKVLKDEGIGTDRTIGNGFFEVDSDYIELNLPKSNKVSNLSLFLPETQKQIDELLKGDNIAYDFQKRGGWITDSGLNTFRKNTVQMFSESSVFLQNKNVEKEFVLGKIVDLKPKGIEAHPIWRSGKAIFIPVKI
ncbi:MAG: type III-A CRISPR-associated RAMP protein Csm4 [Draconibacterium sp.]|nr:type III-A CRISPR-associated RAMP protein Csm4 [Draconibacterium sp.]